MKENKKGRIQHIQKFENKNAEKKLKKNPQRQRRK